MQTLFSVKIFGLKMDFYRLKWPGCSYSVTLLVLCEVATNPWLCLQDLQTCQPHQKCHKIVNHVHRALASFKKW